MVKNNVESDFFGPEKAFYDGFYSKTLLFRFASRAHTGMQGIDTKSVPTLNWILNGKDQVLLRYPFL